MGEHQVTISDVIVEWFGDVWALKRKHNSTRNKLARRIYAHLFKSYMNRRGSFVGLSADIADPPVFPHGAIGVFISGGATIGANCVIFHHVTIGSNTLTDSRGKGSPIIGDNVYIGAGAKIIGNVIVGNNVRIGANAVVFRDIPGNSVVVSPAPRIIHKQDMDNSFTCLSRVNK